MTHFLRHTAVCLWLTLLIGGIGGLWVLPVLQPVLGIDAMPFLVAGALAAVFFSSSGRLTDRLSWVTRLMCEAPISLNGKGFQPRPTYREALAALDRFDVATLGAACSLAGRLARFYLAQAHLDSSEDFITQYLQRPGRGSR
jgi:hypothetical protein